MADCGQTPADSPSLSPSLLTLSLIFKYFLHQRETYQVELQQLRCQIVVISLLENKLMAIVRLLSRMALKVSLILKLMNEIKKEKA